MIAVGVALAVAYAYHVLEDWIGSTDRYPNV